MDFDNGLEQIFKQFKFFRFPAEDWLWCSDEFRQFWSSVDVSVEIGRVAIAHQLLTGQQNLVCLNCCRGVLTSKLWLNCGACLLLVAWRSCRGAMGDFFLKSCRHVKSFFWVRINWTTRLIDRGSHFRMRIILGTIPISFLVFHVCVPECSRNGSWVCPYLWVQEKFVFFRQSTQLCPAELLGQFLTAITFNLVRNLCHIFLVNSTNGRVSWLVVPRMF